MEYIMSDVRIKENKYFVFSKDTLTNKQKQALERTIARHDIHEIPSLVIEAKHPRFNKILSLLGVK